MGMDGLVLGEVGLLVEGLLALGGLLLSVGEALGTLRALAEVGLQVPVQFMAYTGALPTLSAPGPWLMWIFLCLIMLDFWLKLFPHSGQGNVCSPPGSPFAAGSFLDVDFISSISSLVDWQHFSCFLFESGSPGGWPPYQFLFNLDPLDNSTEVWLLSIMHPKINAFLWFFLHMEHLISGYGDFLFVLPIGIFFFCRLLSL